jgi:glycosyltransferase involved in cell wall biosynthesis
MKVALISCWRKGYYGYYAQELRKALEVNTGSEVRVVTSNCGCYPPWYLSKEDFIDQRCQYFNMPVIINYRPRAIWKYHCRLLAQKGVSYLRGLRFYRKTGGLDIIHFQQVENGFGFMSVFYFLKHFPSDSRVVVTLHEIDSFQNEFPELNKIYNKADKVVVHFDDVRKYLISHGVDEHRIEIINNGIEISPLLNHERQGIIFHGGTHLTSGKGLEDLFLALKILRNKGISLTLKLYGNYEKDEEKIAGEMAERNGISELIDWLKISGLEFKGIGAVNGEYQKSMIAVIPYTKGTGGFQTALAMANGLPIIATKKAGVFDHLGENGIYVHENSPGEIAEALEKLVNDATLRKELGQRGRERAKQFLSWDVIGEKTCSLYKGLLARN